MKNEIIGSVHINVRDSSRADKSPICAPVMTGIPIAPKAPEAAFAIKQSAAAFNGLKPSSTSSAALIAIGTPKPTRAF